MGNNAFYPQDTILNNLYDDIAVGARMMLVKGVPLVTTHQNAATAIGDGTAADVEGYGLATFQVTGTFTATITFQGSVDGTNYVPIFVLDSSGTRVSSTTVPGIFRADIAGLKSIRTPISSYTSGQVTVVSRALPVARPVDQSVSLNGSFDTFRTPVTGVKTVTATAAEIFAGASRLTGRRKMILKNEDPVLRFRVGPSSVTQQNGFPVEPGAVLELTFDPNVSVPVYAISEGTNLQVAVMEL